MNRTSTHVPPEGAAAAGRVSEEALGWSAVTVAWPSLAKIKALFA